MPKRSRFIYANRTNLLRSIFLTPAVVILLQLVLISIIGCNGAAQEKETAVIITTTSYMQAALHDLVGSKYKIISLAGPSMCPGHFDIKPSDAILIMKANILFRFDFQKAIEDKIKHITKDKQETKIVTIEAAGGLCIPSTYSAVVEKIASSLIEANLADEAIYERVKQIQIRMDKLSNKIKKRIKEKGLEGKCVLASRHQAEFCSWLGLNVVGALPAADAATIGQINKAVLKARENSVRLIIANKQEGTLLAESIAEKIGAKVVIFSNFPQIDENIRENFDRLIEDNVENLIKAYERN